MQGASVPALLGRGLARIHCVPARGAGLMPPQTPPEPALSTVSAVIVSFADPAASLAAVKSLLAQSQPPLEVLVLDNHPERRLDPAALGRLDSTARVRLIHQGENLGYTTACNRAAAVAEGEWLFFLNPDAQAEPDALARLLAAADARTGVVGAQVLLPDGRTNAGDNPLHVTGVAWAGRYGQQREHGPPRAVASVSGAALMARREAFQAVGGMCERFFMYVDDVDLCWRIRLAGWGVAFCPEAVVRHDYEFEKGTSKWFWLERNRLWTVFSNYSTLALGLLAPLLVAGELMVLVTALRGGWLRDLWRAWWATATGSPEMLGWRSAVQSQRVVGDAELIGLMTGVYDSELVDSPLVRGVNPVVERYRRGVVRVLELAGR